MKNRFQELDCLRGLAASLVVCFHILGDYAFFKVGVTGVDLFFIISGFVIFMSINAVSSGKEFVINRLSRLYPTYWVCVTLTFFLSCAGGALHIKTYLANMTMFQYYLGKPDLDGSYWTMIIEMLFYILILILFTTKLLKYIIEIGVTIVLGVLANSILRVNNLHFMDTYYVPLLNFFPLFFAGVIFYRIYNRQGNSASNYLIILLCYITQIMLFKFTKASWRLNQPEYALMLAIYFTLVTLFVNGWLKFIVVRPLLFLGKISFSLYLIHQYFLLLVAVPFLMHEFHISWLAASLIAIPVAVLIATLINYFFEVPGTKLMKDFLKRKFMTKQITASH